MKPIAPWAQSVLWILAGVVQWPFTLLAFYLYAPSVPEGVAGLTAMAFTFFALYRATRRGRR